MPTRNPCWASRWAVRRTVVVLPLVPVTATRGVRPFSPSRNIVEIIASPTSRPPPHTPPPPTDAPPPPGAGDDAAVGHLGVHVVGHVGGAAAGREVGVVAQGHAAAFGRHGVGAQTLAGQADRSDVV